MDLLITGSRGFVGRHVKERFPPILTLSDSKGSVDLRDVERLEKLILSYKLSHVIHLAAQAFVPESFSNPRETFDINFTGTFNLLTALEKAQFTGKMLYVGTGDMYGAVSPEQLPIRETYSLAPRSPYSVSKVAADRLCYQWSQTADFQIVMARPFNHIGAGQNDRFVVSNFAKQVMEIKLGLREPVLHVGDLGVSRDFTDVRDVARAFEYLLNKGVNGEAYNICSGKECLLSEVLVTLLELAAVEATIQQDPSRMRNNEHRRIYGSCEKLTNDTGWKPEIPLVESLGSLLDYWEEEISKELKLKQEERVLSCV
jgi:GDP-4-dehydro-6-deoxy-D-mannose reductase